MRPIKQGLQAVGVILVYVAAWWGLSAVTGSALLLPSPWETGKSLVYAFSHANAWLYTGMTLLRILAGFLIGSAVGIALAVLTAHVRPLYVLLTPLRTTIKTTPIASFILILLITVVSGGVPVWISALMVIPVLWSNTETAITQLDPKLYEMGRVFFSPARRFRYVTLPQLLPQVLASATTGFGLAWKAAVMAEVLSLPQLSIGKQLYESKLYLETDVLFAWTLVVILLSLALELLMKKLAGRVRT